MTNTDNEYVEKETLYRSQSLRFPSLEHAVVATLFYLRIETST